MSSILRDWLNNEVHLSKHVDHIEEDFRSGYLLGEILSKHGVQEDFESFAARDSPDGAISNMKKLLPAFRSIGVDFNSKRAKQVMAAAPGAASSLLHETMMALRALAADEQRKEALSQTIPLSRSQARQLKQLRAPLHRTSKLESATAFDDRVRVGSMAPKQYRLALQLQRFEDTAHALHERADRAAQEENERREHARRALREAHLEHVRENRRLLQQWEEENKKRHRQTLQHFRNAEKRDLTFELSVREKKRRQLQARALQAQHDAESGIGDFEKTLAQIGGLERADARDSPRASKIHDGTLSDESHDQTLERLAKQLPTQKQASASVHQFMDGVRAKRAEEERMRRERERRRRRILVEQEAARLDAQNQKEREDLLHQLAHTSKAEREFCHKLWLIRQEKTVAEENRKFREQQYQEARERMFKESIARNAARIAAERSTYNIGQERERERVKELQRQRNERRAAKHRALGEEVFSGMVDLAVRVADIRALTETGIRRAEWRDMVAGFISDAAYSPILHGHEHARTTNQRTPSNGEKRQSESENEGERSDDAQTGGANHQASEGDDVDVTTALDEVALRDIILAEGAWESETGAERGGNASMGAIVHELREIANPPPSLYHAVPPWVHSLQEKASAILSIIGPPLSGKTSLSSTLYEELGVHSIVMGQAIADAVDAAKAAAAEVAAESENDASSAPSLGQKASSDHSISQQQPTASEEIAADTVMATYAATASTSTDQDDLSESAIRAERVLLGRRAHAALEQGKQLDDDLVHSLVILQLRAALAERTKSLAAESEGAENERDRVQSNRGGAKEKAATAAKGAKTSKSKAGTTRKGVHASSQGSARDQDRGLQQRDEGTAVGFVFDGYPRTLRQAQMLEELLSGFKESPPPMRSARDLLRDHFAPPPPPTPPTAAHKSGIDAIVRLEVHSEETLVHRALGSRHDAETGAAFHIEHAPPTPEQDVADRLIQDDRDRENESTIVQRISAYNSEETNLLSWFSRFDTVVSIQADEERENVRAAVVAAVKQLQEAREIRRAATKVDAGAQLATNEAARGLPSETSGANDTDLSTSDPVESLLEADNVANGAASETPGRDNHRIHGAATDAAHNKSTIPEVSDETGDDHVKLHAIAEQRAVTADFASVVTAGYDAAYESYFASVQETARELRREREHALARFAGAKKAFLDFLNRDDDRQLIVHEFQENFNAVHPDMRHLEDTKAELHERVEELRDALWEKCDARRDASDEERRALREDGYIALQLRDITRFCIAILDAEWRRYVAVREVVCSIVRRTISGTAAPQLDAAPEDLVTAFLEESPERDAGEKSDPSVAGGKRDAKRTKSARSRRNANGKAAEETPRGGAEDADAEDATHDALLAQIASSVRSTTHQLDERDQEVQEQLQASLAHLHEQIQELQERERAAIADAEDAERASEAAAERARELAVTSQRDDDGDDDGASQRNAKADAVAADKDTRAKSRKQAGKKSASPAPVDAHESGHADAAALEEARAAAADAEHAAAEKRRLATAASQHVQRANELLHAGETARDTLARYASALQRDAEITNARVERLGAQGTALLHDLQRREEHLHFTLEIFAGARFKGECSAVEALAREIREAIESAKPLARALVLSHTDVYADDDVRAVESGSKGVDGAPVRSTSRFELDTLHRFARRLRTEADANARITSAEFAVLLARLARADPAFGAAALPTDWCSLPSSTFERVAELFDVHGSGEIDVRTVIMNLTFSRSAQRDLPLAPDTDAILALRDAIRAAAEDAESLLLTREQFAALPFWFARDSVEASASAHDDNKHADETEDEAPSSHYAGDGAASSHSDDRTAAPGRARARNELLVDIYATTFATSSANCATKASAMIDARSFLLHLCVDSVPGMGLQRVFFALSRSEDFGLAEAELVAALGGSARVGHAIRACFAFAHCKTGESATYESLSSAPEWETLVQQCLQFIHRDVYAVVGF